MSGYIDLPNGLPFPENDGMCDHLHGLCLPKSNLNPTSNELVDLSSLRGKTVLYFYPMTGVPGVALPDGWDEIPGARGCTPQSCSFRDHKNELSEFGAQVFGVSAQSSNYQLEAKNRLQLPFELLSDESLSLKTALSLPTFETAGMELYKRVTLVCENNIVQKVFYPVFPPHQNADDVVNWLRENNQA